MFENDQLATGDGNCRKSLVFWVETVLLSLVAGRQSLVTSRYPKVAVCILAHNQMFSICLVLESRWTPVATPDTLTKIAKDQVASFATCLKASD